MRRYLLFSVLVAIGASGCTSDAPDRILIFSKTAGYRHASIEAGVAAIARIAEEKGFAAIHTEDASYFTEDSLATFDAVVFVNTTGDVLDAVQQADFERYIQAGGGYLGIHSASDTEYDWPWYGQLVGAYFVSHPAIQEATIEVTDTTHPATTHLSSSWVRTDEWYNFDHVPEGVSVLARLDESSYDGGSMNGDHPVVWFHDFDGGRAFYSALGHTNESYSEPEFVSMLSGAIDWVSGGKRNYARARTDRVPLENRFAREILAAGLDEPMELEILDENRIAFVQRKGLVRIYNRESGALTTAAQLDVYTDQEDGLLGIAKDPGFDQNNWIYLFYSPPGTEPMQRVSRFVMNGDAVDLSSEVVVLTIHNQRDECCHAAGSLEFDGAGNLFISVGDDTNPFASDGFSPSDERPNRAPWDAQRTSANANDLRGKILRITPQPDGSYTIPDGNLFPEGTEGTRPEVYAMGLRNPYRISIDNRTGFLYWGDVGPDAGADSDERGPKGYDHINQARHAGFWGWPYSRGNRYAYVDYDFATGTSGDHFNVDAPLNDSPNNTGIRQLPAVEKPFVWYPYDESEEFPWTGTGGRTAMAGPIYHHEDMQASDDAFPDYFDGKLLGYEWMRDWIFVIAMNDEGDFERADPFLPTATFNNPTDMAFGPDGSLYILEYGETWKASNADARLNRISFTDGNRPPIAAISVDRSAGALPLKITASARESSDPDGEPLTFTWSLDGTTLTSGGSDGTIQFDVTEAGDHELAVVASDPGGRTGRATVNLVAGNEPPNLQLNLSGNHQFFWSGRRLTWSVTVADAEDGSLGNGIEPAAVETSLLVEPHRRSDAASEEQAYAGAELIGRSDCGACHALDKRVNGPSFREVAGRYSMSDVAYLSRKIINGGSGVWGETVMAAHPQLLPRDVQTMVEYILATGNAATRYPLELSGSRKLGADAEGATRMVVEARYTDRGSTPSGAADGATVRPLATSDRVVLVAPRFEAEDAPMLGADVSAFGADDARVLGGLANEYFAFPSVDLRDITAIDLGLQFAADYAYGGTIEIRYDGIDGSLLGSQVVQHSSARDSKSTQRIRIDRAIIDPDEQHDLYFVFRSASSGQYVANVDWVAFRP